MGVTLAPAGYRRFSLLFVCLATSCSKPGPSNNELRSGIDQNTPGMTVTDLKCESFADKAQEGVGRSGCKGTLALSQDQYVALSQVDAANLLVSAGIPGAGANFFLQRHPQRVYSQISSKGAETSFESECSYRRVVDAWDIGCTTNYQPFTGQPLASLEENASVKGSQKFDAWIAQTQADYKQLDEGYRAAENKVKSFFAQGRTIVLQNKQTGQTLYRARLDSALTWQGVPGVLGHQSFFSVIVKYQDLRENNNQTLCGYRKGQPIDDLLITGAIDFTSASPQATFNPRVQIIERNALFGNTFTGCGNFLSWNGRDWASGFNSSIELISK